MSERKKDRERARDTKRDDQTARTSEERDYERKAIKRKKKKCERGGYVYLRGQ